MMGRRLQKNAARSGPAAFGVVAARSDHTAGVNVAYLDGHVDFVTSNIDLDAWRNNGQRTLDK